MTGSEKRKMPLIFYGNLFWLLFSLVTCIESFRLGLGAVTKPGSGFFPFSAGIVMLALALVSLVQSLRKRTGEEKSVSEEPFRWWSIVIIVASIIAYALTLDTIGFLINTFLFITIMLKVVEPQTWKTSIIGGLISSIVANVLFNVIFRAQIPSGILGF